MNQSDVQKLRELIDAAKRIVIVQADNPDGDSLASALALEQILSDMGKEPFLYCGVDMPDYLKYLQGWDRVSNELPKNFDISIVVDASTMTLLERIQQSGQQGWLAAKPCIVLDHHAVTQNAIPFATVTINEPHRASTGELIYLIGKELQWPISVPCMEFLMTSILGDTQGLTNNLASSLTYQIMSEFIDAGVDRPKLEDLRREYSKMEPVIFKYKAALIERTEFHADNRIALVTIPQSEINEYSPLYNPAPLIQTDMLQTKGVSVAIAIKQYKDGRLTAAIRCNPGYTIAAALAETFGGGGHAYASGFKVNDGRKLPEIKSECIAKATKLLDNLAIES